VVRSDVATASPWASSLQHTTTFAPAVTNSCAQPLPIPLLPPVTITTLSAYRKQDIISPSRVFVSLPFGEKASVFSQQSAFCQQRGRLVQRLPKENRPISCTRNI